MLKMRKNVEFFFIIYAAKEKQKRGFAKVCFEKSS